MDAPTYPLVMLIESNAADNDDWITDHAGDPDAITYTNYTEGTECVVANIVRGRQIGGYTGNKADARAGGETYEERTGKRQYKFIYQLEVNTMTQRNYWVNFGMLERHNEVLSWKQVYLVDGQAASNYRTFVDNGGNLKEYCKVAILSCTETSQDTPNNKFIIQLVMVSDW